MYHLPGSFTSAICASCGTVFLDPQPSDEELAVHYPDDYKPWSVPPPRFDSPSRARLRTLLTGSGPLGAAAALAASRLRGIETFRLARRFPRPGRVLDIGCGIGDALDSFAKLGWRTAGLEPGARAAEIARSRGHEVLTGVFPETAPEGPFDLVLFVHSLEHVRDPAASLERAGVLLSPGGAIFVATPNAGGGLAQSAGADWWQLDAPRHLVVLTEEGLRSTAARAGLRVADVHTHSVPMGPLVTARLRSDPSFRIDDWFDIAEPALDRTRARVASVGRDLAGCGDNLHAVLDLAAA